MKDAHILLVEDDPVAGESLRVWLERKGSSATYVNAPAAADIALERQKFDVLLSDIQMPGNEDLAWIADVARRLPDLQIVLITGVPRLDTAIRATNLHVAAFLVKPPDFAELETVIATLTATARMRRRLKACMEELRAARSREGSSADVALAEPLRELNQLWPLIETDPRALSIVAAADLREALVDAIQVIERTKDSFQSRELGKLRQRLQRALAE